MTINCVICSKAVYPVEMIQIDDKPMHKACLRCTHCNSTLSLGKYAAINGKYYCKPHFKQLFALKGNYTEGFGEEKKYASNPQTAELTKAGSIASLKRSRADLLSDGEHANEEESEPIRAIGKVSDRIGSSIDDLSKALGGLTNNRSKTNLAGSRSNSRSNLTGSRSNLFGSRSNMVTRSRTNLAKSISNDNEESTQTSKVATAFNNVSALQQNKNSCNICSKTAYPMEQVVVESVVMHKTCFRCAHCNNVLSLGKYAALDGKYYCKPHFKQLFALKGNYNEGFGTRPHKEKWLDKEVSDEIGA